MAVNTKIFNTVYDVIIIGSGVVGCAMARRFALQGAKVLVLEKALDILDGASKANSAILHTGFDAPSESIELKCIQDGYQEYLSLAKNHNLMIEKSGAMVVAWNDNEAKKLESIITKAHDNDVTSVTAISTREIQRQEPKLSKSAVGAAWVPNEFLVDPWTSPHSYLLEAISAGADISRNSHVVSGQFHENHWQIFTQEKSFRARTVINCAGLYGDHLDEELIGKTFFKIKPRKGQFVVYDKAASKLLNSIILPVPNEVTKGIVVCRTIFGNVLVGPTAEEQDSRSDASVAKDTLKMLCKKAQEILPEIKNIPITATYAGIRPATQYKDYCINSLQQKQYISVGGIRSTGLSSALGLAKYVYHLYDDLFGFNHKPNTSSSYPSLSPIAENDQRDWCKQGNKGIVCHCELVTKREVENALTGPLAAKSLAGLKRRTRATMGRCQGFYCSANLAEITKGCFDSPMSVKIEPAMIGSAKIDESDELVSDYDS